MSGNCGGGQKKFGGDKCTDWWPRTELMCAGLLVCSEERGGQDERDRALPTNETAEVAQNGSVKRAPEEDKMALVIMVCKEK